MDPITIAKMFEAAKAKKAKKAPSAAWIGRAEHLPPPTPVVVSPANNINLGTAGDPRYAPVAPAPVADPGSVPGQGGMSGQQWLQMALSALGGGPDRAAYVAPFDAAEQRAREANAQALPQIAQGYDQMRAQLGTGQQVVDRDAQQARDQMAAVNAALQGQISQHAAPILADLQSQGGTPALGGLLGGAQAQIGAGQAQLAQQAATQQQLSGNMQAASTASHQSRLADSHLGQAGATATANNTLNSVLAQIDAKRANALQQYAADAQRHGASTANARLQAAERDAEGSDPGRQIDLEIKRLDLAERQRELAERQEGGSPDAGRNKYTSQLIDFHTRTAEKNPVAWSTLTRFLTEGGENGTPLPTVIANIRQAQDKNGKILGTNGKFKIDANWMIDRAKELDELERLEEEEEFRREVAKKKRR